MSTFFLFGVQDSYATVYMSYESESTEMFCMLNAVKTDQR